MILEAPHGTFSDKNLRFGRFYNVSLLYKPKKPKSRLFFSAIGSKMGAKKKCYGDCRVIDYDYYFLLIL